VTAAESLPKMWTMTALVSGLVIGAALFHLLVPPGIGPQGPRGLPGEDGADGQDTLPWHVALFRVRFTCRIADCTDLRMDLYGSVEEGGQRFIVFLQDERFQTHAPENTFAVLWNGSLHTILTLHFFVVETGYSSESPPFFIRDGSAWVVWEVSVR
jgi:hypothetical protein